jgi:GNAT superfamily N-acetyltransferase
MSVVFKVEQWSDVLHELRPLFSLLWEDVALDKERFVAKHDDVKYTALDKAGILHLVTARLDGTLIGYFVSMLTPNPHYVDAGLMAFTDQYYIIPEYRKGNTGLKLFAFVEKCWLEKGVVKAYNSHKLHRDRGPMFRMLGWKPTDLIYTKVYE